MPTQKELEKALERKREQKGTADKALHVLDNLKTPDKAHDEVKDLREELRDVRKHAIERIEAIREHLADLADKYGAEAAVKWAVAHDGVTESPSGSNWGVPVQDWIKRTGYTSPVPWCGCFVHEAVVVIGGAKVSSNIRYGYGPSIIADAKAGTNGFKAVPFSQAQAGDVLVFWGGQHIGLCRGKPNGSVVPTVEGNTSPLPGAGQYNGGAVEVKSRNASDVSVVARPTYP